MTSELLGMGTPSPRATHTHKPGVRRAVSMGKEETREVRFSLNRDVSEILQLQ